jgi:pyruvate dehydrogenase E2 component (dihydrolipoamide acetyltransferase)
MTEFLMPSLGADMETGQVVEWLVKAGDRVKPGDVVAVIETHKGAIEVEIFLDGVINQLAPLDKVLPVGAVLAQVTPDQQAPVPATVAAATPKTTLRVRVSPAARHRAAALGLDPDSLSGTGPQAAVTLADVNQAAAGRQLPALGDAAAQTKSRGIDTTQMRQAIAAAMSRSKREIPHYYLSETIDFSVANDWLSSWNAARPPAQRLLSAVLLLKAAALALREVPQLNGFFAQGAFQAGQGIHIGWAITLRGGGLVAPAIHDVDQKSLPELMHAVRDVVQRARLGRLRSSEMTDPTITITNLGDRGVEAVLGVIYPPQVAIVGYGRILARPWVVNGQVTARQLVNASLAADHRASDGHLGGLLLTTIGRALQSPQTL